MLTHVRCRYSGCRCSDRFSHALQIWQAHLPVILLEVVAGKKLTQLYFNYIASSLCILAHSQPSATIYAALLSPLDPNCDLGRPLISEGRKAWQDRQGRHRSPSTLGLYVDTDWQKRTLLAIVMAIDYIEGIRKLAIRRTYTISSLSWC